MKYKEVYDIVSVTLEAETQQLAEIKQKVEVWIISFFWEKKTDWVQNKWNAEVYYDMI